MLEISHVKKSFGKNHVLRDVSMKVNKGDVIVILGPSGSGKTTLLNIINGNIDPNSGSIAINGINYK